MKEKIKLQIKNIFGKLLFEYECEDNTIKKTVTEAIKNSANLRYADLRSADLHSADLHSADLRYANLSYADLRYADLSYVNLSYAKTDKRYIQISCIGSEKRMTTYCFENDKIWCGCFTGTLKDFEKQVQKTHKHNENHLKEYIGFINYLKSLK